MTEKRTLGNGIRIVFEYIPYVRSVSLGVWIGCGSRHERASENGMAHFLEHMIFKGTETQSAADLAALTDRLGGGINAYTAKDCTCLYGRVLDTNLVPLVDMFGDMLMHSLFRECDVESERNVIFDEMHLAGDTPDDLVYERLVAGIYKGSSLGRPILGSRKTLDRVTGEGLRDFLKNHYDPHKIVIAVSGSFTAADIDHIESVFSQFEGRGTSYKSAEYKPYFTAKRRKLEQNHLILAFPGIVSTDERKYAYSLMSNILGGNTSSRLFQSVRERNGLCYTVYSITSGLPDTGVFGIYAALSEDSEVRALSLITEEIEKVKNGDITQAELDLSIEQYKSNLLMSLESTGSRMNMLGHDELFYDRVITHDEIVSRYESVTLDDIAAIANAVFVPEKISFSAIGRVKTAEEYRDMLR